jgi:hypothetical protein
MPQYLTALETRPSKLRASLRRLCSQSGDAHHNTTIAKFQSALYLTGRPELFLKQEK